MSLARLGRVASVAAIPLLLLGAGGPGRLGTSRGGDTLTTAYEVGGVRVIQRLNPASAVVAVRLFLLGGTRQLTERTAGIEALLLRAAAYGTAQFQDEEARRAMDRTGYIVTLDPELDWTVFGLTGLAEDLDAAWLPFADRLTHPTLSAAAVARARARLLSAAHRRYTEPDERLHVLAMRALFRDHPYALDPSGTEQSIAAITPDDLRTYARDQLVTSRMLLVVVGNVPRAHVESLVTATLAHLPHGEYHWTLPPSAPSHDSRWLIDNRPLPTAYMLGLFAGPPPTSHYYWSFRVAAALLSSRLFEAIRVQRSLSYVAYAPYVEAAIPVAGAYVSTPKPDSALQLVVNQIVELESRELDYSTLARFVDTFRFDYLADNATAAGQADVLARAELYLGSYRRGDEFLNRLYGVSPHDIRVMASQYMTRIQYAYLGDPSRMHGHW